MATEKAFSAKQIAAQLYTVREFTKTEADIARNDEKSPATRIRSRAMLRTRSGFARGTEKHC